MKVNDAISGAAFVVLAGIIFWMCRDFRLMPGQPYGAGFVPRLIATAMAGLGLILIVQGLRHRSAGPWVEVPDWLGSSRHMVNALLVVAVLIFYILFSDWLGFLITGFVCLGALLVWLRGPKTWLSSLAITLVCVLALQTFFGDGLRVPLPWGVLQAWEW